MQGQDQIESELLYNLLCVLKPLIDHGFYDPWNEEEVDGVLVNVRKQREHKNKKMTDHLVKLCRYGGKVVDDTLYTIKFVMFK